MAKMRTNTQHELSQIRSAEIIVLFILVIGETAERATALKEIQPPRLLLPIPSTRDSPHIGPMDYISPTTTIPPVFHQQNNTEIRSQVGTTAVLHCRTEHVGENTVSWFRRRDMNLLTVGVVEYSSDQRFSVRYVKSDKDWQLHIRYVQKRDEGIYECQIATHPPIGILSRLHVVEATSEILGAPEKFMRKGSSLRLVCVLKKNTQPPQYVFWYHEDRMINYDSTVKVETGSEVSVLFLGKVNEHSSGNYSCVPSNAQSSHIHVQVLKGGEMPAAIHSGASSSHQLPQIFSWISGYSPFIISTQVALRKLEGFSFLNHVEFQPFEIFKAESLVERGKIFIQLFSFNVKENSMQYFASAFILLTVIFFLLNTYYHGARTYNFPHSTFFCKQGHKSIIDYDSKININTIDHRGDFLVQIISIVLRIKGSFNIQKLLAHRIENIRRKYSKNYV